MALYRATDRVITALIEAPGCFYCSRSFTDMDWIVQWRGHNETISLHQTCAKSLGTHLIKDGFGDPRDGSYCGR